MPKGGHDCPTGITRCGSSWAATSSKGLVCRRIGSVYRRASPRCNTTPRAPMQQGDARALRRARVKPVRPGRWQAEDSHAVDAALQRHRAKSKTFSIKRALRLPNSVSTSQRSHVCPSGTFWRTSLRREQYYRHCVARTWVFALQRQQS